MEVLANGHVALSGDDDVETLRGWFDSLADGGTVEMLPFGRRRRGDWFGSVADRYGVSWMVNASGGATGD